MEDRKLNERNFHNKQRTVVDDDHVADTRWSPALEKTIESNPLWANMKYYSVERESRDHVLNWYKAECVGKRVLDYCCGNGEDSIILAQMGAKEVTGIDISDVSVENCTRLAEKNDVADRVTFEVGDAEDLRFPDNSFDIMTEYGALHHIDLNKALPEIVRVLRPEGKMICVEALGHNPAIHVYRRLTPKLRTEWEVDHILRKPQFDLMKEYFESVDMKFYYFFSLAAVPFRNTKIFGFLLSTLGAIDNVFLKIPGIRWWAWQTVFVLSGPKKSS